MSDDDKLPMGAQKRGFTAVVGVGALIVAGWLVHPSIGLAVGGVTLIGVVAVTKDKEDPK